MAVCQKMNARWSLGRKAGGILNFMYYVHGESGPCVTPSTGAASKGLPQSSNRRVEMPTENGSEDQRALGFAGSISLTSPALAAIN
jgi:hypothetical protein